LSEPFRIRTRIDLDADGKQFGTLDVPHSSNESAWGALRVPIVVIKHGRGSTLLCTGGNHGDEYEGPIAIARLIRELDPAAVQGRLILLPSLNLPAARIARAWSPSNAPCSQNTSIQRACGAQASSIGPVTRST